MVQVDVFWSYGIGAGFALSAAHQLRSGRHERPIPSGPAQGAALPYLTVTLLYAAALFAPSGAWLLWQFTSWETMHAGSYGTVPGWLVALFTATNTTQALLGFVVTRWLLDRDRARLACLQVVGAYFGMYFILVHGWDGTGYQRFFSATPGEFRNWSAGEPLAQARGWLGSDVALTLYAMGAVLIPVLLGTYFRWHLAGLRAAGETTPTGRIGARFALAVAGGIVGLGLGGAILASVLIHLLGWLAGGAVFALVAAVVCGAPHAPMSWAAEHLVPRGRVQTTAAMTLAGPR
jgi:hypothetical protein